MTCGFRRVSVGSMIDLEFGDGQGWQKENQSRLGELLAINSLPELLTTSTLTSSLMITSTLAYLHPSRALELRGPDIFSGIRWCCSLMRPAREHQCNGINYSFFCYLAEPRHGMAWFWLRHFLSHVANLSGSMRTSPT